MPRLLRQVTRRLGRSPGFAAIAVLTLAIGIGATAAIFAVADGVILKPLPYPDPDRLVGIWHTAPGVGIKELNASPSTYITYREEGKTFQDVGIWSTYSVSITGVAEPEQVAALFVTDGTLPILGVPPATGRWFTPKEDSPSGERTVMLTHGYWKRRFGGDPSVLGRRLQIDGDAHEVIGIMPERFRFLDERAEVILPLRLERSRFFLGNFSYLALGRLKPGVTIQQASADIARMIPIVGERFQAHQGLTRKMYEETRMAPNLRPLKNDVVRDAGNVVWVLMGTIAIVLLISCANVANLLLVRAEGRRQELTIRTALGASWLDTARELLVESLVLWGFGGLIGLGLAYAAVRALVTIAPAGLPRISEITIDPRVLLFTIAVSLVSGLIFGFLPVLRQSSTGIGLSLREGGRGLSHSRERHRMRNAFVVAQVALALVLLTGSGLMLRTAWQLRSVDPGFRAPQEVLTLRVSIPEAMASDPERAMRMHQAISERIATIPGVSGVGMASSITLDGSRSSDPIYAEGHHYDESKLPPIRRYKSLAPGFLATLGTPLVAGRDLTWTDIYDDRPVVLLSDNLARELWGSPALAVGKRVRESNKGRWREVIGVVGAERDQGLDQDPPKIVYWPVLVRQLWNFPVQMRRSLVYAIRSPRTGTPQLLDDVRKAVWAVNGDLPLARVRTLDEIYQRAMARTSFTLVILSLAGAMALLLGLIGIYGVLSYAVTQRTREIGIRMALGAQHGEVRRLFVRQGIVLAAIGAAIGLIASAGVTRFLASLLFGVDALDPLTFGATALVLVLAAAIASYVPARRATGVDPVEALRAE